MVGRTVLQKGVSVRLTPSILSGVVDLKFTSGVSDRTGPDGEYTLEYLNRGAHSIIIPFNNCGKSTTPCEAVIDLQSSRTGLDFQMFSLGEFGLNPGTATVAVHDRLDYAFTWTVPEPLNWHALQFLQSRIREGADIVFSVLFDEASNTFALLTRPRAGSTTASPQAVPIACRRRRQRFTWRKPASSAAARPALASHSIYP